MNNNFPLRQSLPEASEDSDWTEFNIKKQQVPSRGGQVTLIRRTGAYNLLYEINFKCL